MSVDTLSTLKNLDPALLTEIVRKQQNSPSFELLDWSVEPISHEKVIDTTGGLFRFSGQGQDDSGIKRWSIVLKILNKSEFGCYDPRDWCYWKRELLAFQSGMLAELPNAIRVPHSYGVIDHEDNGWIWMENIVESTEHSWSLEHFHHAARQSGRFSGTYLTSIPLPDHPWLSAPFFRSLLANGEWWANYMDPETSDGAWQQPNVQQAFAEPLRSRVLRLWAEKLHFFDVLDRLPQVLCHNDLHRRNLMIRTGVDGQEEVVALDWAFCGRGAVGTDMGELLATTLYYFDFDLARAHELEKSVLEGYLAGLHDAGWTGDTRLARLGYLISAALWMGATLPGWAAGMLGEEATVNTMAMYGQPPDETLAGWVTLEAFLLERADEARVLIHELNLG